MQFIVHIYLFSHDMKVRQRPVLTAVASKLNATSARFWSISHVIVPGPRPKKTTLAVAVIGCNAADSGKINDRQFCSHVWAHCCLVGKKKRLTKRKRSLQKRRVCSQPYCSTAHTWRSIC